MPIRVDKQIKMFINTNYSIRYNKTVDIAQYIKALQKAE